MDNDTIETVARALAAHIMGEDDPTGKTLPGDLWRQCEGKARAAITAHLKALEDKAMVDRSELQRLGDIEDAAQGIVEDLKDRAKWQRNAYIVNCGNGAYLKLCAALEQPDG